MKSALITGINGQDGSYLAEHLLEEDYRVYGLVRRTSIQNLQRVSHLLERIELLNGDLLDQNTRTRSTTWRRNRSSPPRSRHPC